MNPLEMKTYRKFIICVILSMLSNAGTAVCGQVYKWVDKNGVTHFTDSLTDSSVSENYDVEHRQTEDDDKDSSYVLEDQEEGEFSILKNVLTEYHRTHTYSTPDFFVCSDMAIEVWNILKTKGIRSVIYAGIVDKNVYWKGNLDYLKKMDHAWVLAEFALSNMDCFRNNGWLFGVFGGSGRNQVQRKMRDIIIKVDLYQDGRRKGIEVEKLDRFGDEIFHPPAPGIIRNEEF